MNFNLFLAVLWFIAGLILIAVPWFNPQFHVPTILGSSISVGWLPLVLTLYNLARWWNTRSAQAQRRLTEEARLRQERREHEKSKPLQERDPNFIFDEPPPKED